MGSGVTQRSQSSSNEWYTPAWVIEHVRRVFNDYIWLDPASCEEANQVVGAEYWLDEYHNALEADWRGLKPPPDGKRKTVFVNPPYGKIGNKSSAGLFLQRMIDQYELGHFDEAIMLVNAVEYEQWFKPALKLVRATTIGLRIKFWRGEGEENSPLYGNSFIYIGDNWRGFADVFSDFCEVKVPSNIAAGDFPYTLTYRHDDMTADFYQQQSAETIHENLKGLDPEKYLLYMLAGLVSEIGEYAGLIKRQIRDGKEPDTSDLKAETGDVEWYLSRIEEYHDLPKSAVLRHNLSKLLSRKQRGVIGGKGDHR